MEGKMKALNVNAKPFVPGANCSSFATPPAISKLPEEMLVKIFSLLPCRDLLTVEKTCKQWADLCKNDFTLKKIIPNIIQRIKNKWQNNGYYPSKEEIADANSLGIISLKLNIFIISCWKFLSSK